MYQFYLLYSWINWKNGTKVFWCFSDSFKWIQHKIDFKTVHARSISWPFRHLLSLLNESVTSISISQIIWEFIREFKRINKINNNTILYTTHSVSREKDDYNLTFDFVLSIIVCTLIFNLYIFVTGRGDSDQKVIGQLISWYVEEGAKTLPIFYMWFYFALKQLWRSNTMVFFSFLINYVCIIFLLN